MSKIDMNETICHCHDVDAKKIADAVENGAATLEEVMDVTEAGTGCGACVDEISNVMEQLKEK